MNTKYLSDYNGDNGIIIKKVPLEDIFESIQVYNIDDLNRIIKSCQDRIKEL